MARDPRSPGNRLDELLGELPDGFIVRALTGAWFVAGPPGIYVVASADPSGVVEPSNGDPADRQGSPTPDADPARLAADVRTVLANDFTLVPFVHPLLMTDDLTDDPADANVGATLVPADLLLGVLVRGSAVLDGPTLSRIDAIAAAGRLDTVGSHHRPPMRGWVGATPVN